MTNGRVYLLWHSYEVDDCEVSKLLGVYSTEERAADRIERSRSLPGFVDHPDDFVIDRYEIDADKWTEGFVRA